MSQHSEESTVEILNTNIYDIAINSLDGDEKILENYKGKVTMIVNVTGECANSAQYNIIQDLYDEYRQKGFEVIATPSTDFCQDAYGEFKNSNASAENMRSHMKKKYGTDLFFSEMVDIKNTEEKKCNVGYNSDGNIGPHFDGVENEPSEEEMVEREDEDLLKSMMEVQSSSTDVVEKEPAPDPFVM